MEQQYKDITGEWRVSEWKDGKYHWTAEDSHTYTKYEDGKVGHVECWCQNK